MGVHVLDVLVRPVEEIPEGQGDSYRSGWDDYYFGPMKKYFGRFASR